MQHVDPLAVLIAYLLSDSDLRLHVADRVAAKHKFAMGDERDETLRGWPTPSRAITLTYAGVDGNDDPTNCPDAGWERVRIDARCYGESGIAAAEVYHALRNAVDVPRTAVPINGLTAVIYYAEMSGGPSAELDPDIHIDLIRTTIRLATARSAI